MTRILIFLTALVTLSACSTAPTEIAPTDLDAFAAVRGICLSEGREVNTPERSAKTDMAACMARLGYRPAPEPD